MIKKLDYKRMIYKDAKELIKLVISLGDSTREEWIMELSTFLKSQYIKRIESEIEWLDSEKKDTRIRSIPEISEAVCSGCGKQEECTCDFYNQALNDHISYLLAQRKLIEEE